MPTATSTPLKLLPAATCTACRWPPLWASARPNWATSSTSPPRSLRRTACWWESATSTPTKGKISGAPASKSSPCATSTSAACVPSWKKPCAWPDAAPPATTSHSTWTGSIPRTLPAWEHPFGGATYREAHLAMEIIADHGRMLSLEIVEVNPVIDEHNQTADLAVELALSAFGKKIL